MIIKGMRWPNDNIGNGMVKGVMVYPFGFEAEDSQYRPICDSLPHEIIHSPGGFEWGYGGSGPADLAFNILHKVTGMRRIALQHYQQFKTDVVAGFGFTFEITDTEVWQWLRSNLHPQAPKVIGSLHC